MEIRQPFDGRLISHVAVFFLEVFLGVIRERLSKDGPLLSRPRLDFLRGRTG